MTQPGPQKDDEDNGTPMLGEEGRGRDGRRAGPKSLSALDWQEPLETMLVGFHQGYDIEAL